MTISVTDATPLPRGSVHPSPVRPSTASGEAQDRPSSGVAPRNTARRLVAITVALSEPADSQPIDWAETIAANLRLLYRNTTVEVIDSWRVDQ